MLQPDSSEVDNVVVEQGRKNSSGSVVSAVRSDFADSSSHKRNDEDESSPLRQSQINPKLPTQSSRDSVVPHVPHIQKKGCSVPAAISAMVVDCVGAGVLVMPATLDSIGYIEGGIWIVVVAVMAALMCILFVDSLKRCVQMAPDRRFVRLEDVAEFALGKIFKWHVIIFFYGTMFWLCVIYFAALGDIMSGVVHLGSQSKILGRLIVLPFIMALSMVKDFNYMAPFSYLGMVGIVVVIVAMVVVSADAIGNHEASDKAQAFVKHQTFSSACAGISTIVYAYGAMLVLPTIYQDSMPRERERMGLSIWVAHAMVAATYLVIAITAYVAFGSGQSDVFTNFYAPTGKIHDDYKVGWYVGAIAVIVHMVIALPAILLGLARRIETHMPQRVNGKGTSPWWRAVVRVLLLACAFGLACTPISFFEQLIGLIPATTGCFLGLVWPPLMWWAIVIRQEGGVKIAVRKYYFKAIFHVIVLVIAVIAIIFGMKGAVTALIDRLKEGGAQSTQHSPSTNSTLTS